MSRKEKALKIMEDFFGPATAKTASKIENEEECVKFCKSKVAAFLGDEKAKVFDGI